MGYQEVSPHTNQLSAHGDRTTRAVDADRAGIDLPRRTDPRAVRRAGRATRARDAPSGPTTAGRARRGSLEVEDAVGNLLANTRDDGSTTQEETSDGGPKKGDIVVLIDNNALEEGSSAEADAEPTIEKSIEEIQAEAIAAAALFAQDAAKSDEEDEEDDDDLDDDSSSEDGSQDKTGSGFNFIIDLASRPKDPADLAVWLAQQLSNSQLQARSQAYSKEILAADREKIRAENRNRKKRWRQSNIDRNKDNDLRCRINKRAKDIFGSDNTPEKLAWMDAEFEKRKAKRESKEKVRTDFGQYPSFRQDTESGDENHEHARASAAASLLTSALLGGENDQSTAEVANALKIALENGTIDPKPFNEALRTLAANPEIMSAIQGLLGGDHDDGSKEVQSREADAEGEPEPEPEPSVENESLIESALASALDVTDFSSIINQVSTSVLEGEEDDNPFADDNIPDVINDVVNQILLSTGDAPGSPTRKRGAPSSPEVFKRARYKTPNGFDPASMDISALLSMGKSVNAVVPISQSQALHSDMVRTHSYPRQPIVNPAHASSFGSTAQMNELLRQRPNAYSRPLLTPNTAPPRPTPPTVPAAEKMKREAEEKKARAFGFPPRPGQLMSRKSAEAPAPAA